jgi:aspartate aminotransferase-like enzyme
MGLGHTYLKMLKDVLLRPSMNLTIPIIISKVNISLINYLEMYDYLAKKGLVIYPGKKTKAPTFRIGSIGEITRTDMEELVTLLG